MDLLRLPNSKWQVIHRFGPSSAPFPLRIHDTPTAHHHTFSTRSTYRGALQTYPPGSGSHIVPTSSHGHLHGSAWWLERAPAPNVTLGCATVQVIFFAGKI